MPVTKIAAAVSLCCGFFCWIWTSSSLLDPVEQQKLIEGEGGPLNISIGHFPKEIFHTPNARHRNKPESEELSESLPAPPKNFDIVTTFQHSGITQELNILFKSKEKTQIKPLGNAFDMRID